MRVAVTGARGRLGRALIEALEAAPFTGPNGPIRWHRPDFDLDTLTGDTVAALLERDRPEVVVHVAAWTDVDGCAKDPALAMRRNGEAAGILATTCEAWNVDLVLVSTNEVFDGRRTDGRGYGPNELRNPINPYGASKAEGEIVAAQAWNVDLVLVSTNEVFDGRRTDGRGYRPSELRNPINPYGASKAEGEIVAAQAFGENGSTARLAIVRTAWLHGPPGNDFPAKIAAAALRAHAAGEPLKVVGDEIGSPTYTPDLAEAIVELLGADAITEAPARQAIHHLVNGGMATRADWAREVLRATGIDVDVVDVPGDTWVRASTPPRWAVLEPTTLPSGEPMRGWREAFADAVPALLRSLRTP